MTCCVEDISFAGLLATGYDTKQLQNQEWVELTAKVAIKHNRVYNKKGPILNVLSLTPGTPRNRMWLRSIECAIPRNPHPKARLLRKRKQARLFLESSKNPLLVT